jgi:SAM-dependent methyltransferase
VPTRRVYDLLYRIGAARWRRGWDTGVGPELRALVEDGTFSPERLGGGRAIDLGCGSGANVLYLAEHGFEATGVDFSPVAVEQARASAIERGLVDRTRFLVGDVTRRIEGVEGPFDLVVLYNVLQDLPSAGRRGLAELTRSLTHPGSKVLLWCWYTRRDDLPLMSYRGPSRMSPFVVEPGEERDLFGDAFEIERTGPQPAGNKTSLVLTRTDGDGTPSVG